MRVGAKAGTARLGLLALIGAIAALLLVPSLASARKTHLFIEKLGSAAQAKTTSGYAAAIDPATGDVLVAGQFGGGSGSIGTLRRFKPNGEPDPFSALGTHQIDGQRGAGKKPCAEEASSCDETPQKGLSFDTVAQIYQLAIDDSGTATDGNIYLTQGKGEAHVVDVFAASGKYLGQLTAAGATPFGSKEDSESPYLSHLGPTGVAVDDEGHLFVSSTVDDKIYEFAPSTNPPLNGDLVSTFSSVTHPANLAVGVASSAGALFAVSIGRGGKDEVLRLDAASGAVKGIVDAGPVEKLAVDPETGNLFDLRGNIGTEEVREHDGKTGALLSAFGASFGALAIGGGKLYLAGNGAERVDVYGPRVTVPDVTSGPTSITGDTSATLQGSVDPDGVLLESCAFEYDTAVYNPNQGPGKHGTSVPCAESPAAIGLDEAAVHAELTGLSTCTVYHYRLVAGNPEDALYPNDPQSPGKGKDRTFNSPCEPTIKAQWSQEVGVSEATLKATVNPQNSETTYHFEWGLTSAYEHSSPERELGSDATDRKIGLRLSGLEPGTAYHYRVVASNNLGVAEGEDRAFTTFRAPGTQPCPENEAFRAGPSAALPDCRAYEMVSPVDKDGGDIVVLGQRLSEAPAVLSQAATSGERLTYGSYRAFGDAKSAPYTSQYMAAREAGVGWQTHGITAPETELISGTITPDFEFRAFSDDLCQGWEIPLSEPPLTEDAIPGYFNLYRRTDQACGGEESYVALTNVAPERLLPHHSDLSPNQIELQGLSADGEVAAFAANDSLVGSGAPPQPADCAPPGFSGCLRALYVKGAVGPPRFACVLPSGIPAMPCVAGSSFLDLFPEMRGWNVSGALAGDAKRLYWTAGKQQGPIYLRENLEQDQSATTLGGAGGKGDLSSGSTAVSSLVAAEGLASFTSGSSTATLLSTALGTFVAGQPIAAPGKLPSGTTILSVSGNTLTLSKAATATSASSPISSKGPLPFAVGQRIAGKGIPSGTTIGAVGSGSLTLSKAATQTVTGTALEASSPCTEAAKACTVAVSAQAEAQEGTSDSFFWAADKSKGARAIFTSGKGLYEFDAASEASTKIAGGVAGVAGASDDATSVYFVSSEAIGTAGPNSEGDEAEAGQANLYLHEAGGAYRFVATLTAADVDPTPFVTSPNGSAIASQVSQRNAHVSADGTAIAFMSRASLTGYDNIDTASGEPDAEVFLYDAGAQQLLCVSCNPSGARPAGANLGTEKLPFWAAARLPVFATTMHLPRALSGSTRLFFESQDALAPSDQNGRLDVYQWERAGTGGCEESSASFSATAEGCVELISTGRSNEDSLIVDANSDGDDVFFTTLSSLVSWDPGLLDVYDARVGGGFAGAPPPLPSCEGEACQGTPEAPNDPTPASETFQGAGNVHEEAIAQKPKPCAKGKVRRKGKCVAKKQHKKAPKRAKRSRGAGR